MSFLIGTLSFVMLAISLFMILLVLIQRGRGGGLAGAFGGMGGQSAFGTRAGDMFTRITIVLAVVWVLLAGGLGMMMRQDAKAAKKGEDKGGFEQGAEAGKKDDSVNETDEAKTDEAKKKEGAKTDDAAKSKADVKSKTDDATPEKTDVPKTDTKTQDAEKSATGEAEKSTPAENTEPVKTEAQPEKTDPPAPAEAAKEVPATPSSEVPSTEPKP
ncbi:MAG: preprotein translocase subunit SecG [Fuerstia sp.]|nr:preprotein translocase subunit SecG [Fuerstiella sp.]